MDDENMKNTNGNINQPEQPKITVISGDGNINISDVHDHLNIDSPSSTDIKKRTIIIPPDNSHNNSNDN